MKRRLILSIVLVLALLGGVGSGWAASAGSAGDPFISLSFLQGDYGENLLAQADGKITDSLDTAFENASAGLSGGDTGSFRSVNMLSGGEIALGFGGSAIVSSGTAVLSIRQGEVIDVTAGMSAPAGSIQTGHRYLAAEDSAAALRFTSAAVVLLDGAAQVVSGEGGGSPFTDIDSGDWFYADVVSAVEMGLIDGMGNGTFVPNGTITNAQVIKLAACTHQKYHEGTVTLQNGSPWYRTYADYALANGIIASEPVDYNAPCSRGYYIAVMYGAMPEREYAVINEIADNAVPDVKQGHVYYDAIYGFYRAGIVTGNDAKGTFAPDSDVKRSEVATLVARMFDASVRRSVSLP